jgi:NADH-quinone oxidoreductase subunit H
MLKGLLGYFIVMWVRSTLPRIRIDHMLDLNWKFLTPVSLVLLVMTAILDKAFGDTALRFPVLFAGNLLVILLGWLALRWASRRHAKERREFEKRPVAKPA